MPGRGGEVALAFALEWPPRVHGVMVANTLAGMRKPSAELRAGWTQTAAVLDAGRPGRRGRGRTADVGGRAATLAGRGRRPFPERVRERDRALLARADEQEQADELVARMPDVRRVDFADAAHLPSMEQPEAFNRTMLEFLERLG